MTTILYEWGIFLNVQTVELSINKVITVIVSAVINYKMGMDCISSTCRNQL